MWYEKTKNGKHKYTERFLNYTTKKRQKVSVTIDVKNPKIARKMLDDRIERKQAEGLGYRPMKRDITIGELKKLYLEYKKDVVKLSSYENIVFYLKRFTVIDDIPINDLNVGILKTNIKKSHLNTNKLIIYFKTFFTWCYKNDYLKERFIIDKLEKEKTKKKERSFLYLESNELKEILNNLDDDIEQHYNMINTYCNKVYRYMLEFQALTGLRAGELIALEKTDIKQYGEYTTISINKTFYKQIKQLQTPKTESSKREITINSRCVEILKEVNILYKAQQMQAKREPINTNLLFSTSTGGYVCIDMYNKFLKKIKQGLTSHLLRHTHASLLAEKGVPLEQIQKRLGHESDTITRKIYIHITEKQKEKERQFFSNLDII